MAASADALADQYDTGTTDTARRIFVASKGLLKLADAKHYRGKDPSVEAKRLIELPELFGEVDQRRESPGLEIEGVLLTMFDKRLRLANQVASEVRRYFGEKVFNTIVQRNVRLSEAPSFSRPVLLYDATSVGSRNYLALAREILVANRDLLEKVTGAESKENTASDEQDVDEKLMGTTEGKTA